MSWEQSTGAVQHNKSAEQENALIRLERNRQSCQPGWIAGDQFPRKWSLFEYVAGKDAWHIVLTFCLLDFGFKLLNGRKEQLDIALYSFQRELRAPIMDPGQIWELSFEREHIRANSCNRPERIPHQTVVNEKPVQSFQVELLGEDFVMGPGIRWAFRFTSC